MERQMIRDVLRRRIAKRVAELGMPAVEAARRCGLDPRNYDRVMKGGASASLERLLRIARHLQVDFNFRDIKVEAWQEARDILRFERELDELLETFNGHSKNKHDQMRLLRTHLIDRLTEDGKLGLSPDERDCLNRFVTLKVLGARKIAGGDPVSIIREQADDGYRFFRSDEAEPSQTLSVSHTTLTSFERKYGSGAFFEEVVVRSLAPDGDVEDIVDDEGRVIWVKE